MTEDNKKFIRGLLDQSNYYFDDEQQQPDWSYPKPTSNDTIDGINYNNWLNTLENNRPDLFIDEHNKKIIEQAP